MDFGGAMMNKDIKQLVLEYEESKLRFEFSNAAAIKFSKALKTDHVEHNEVIAEVNKELAMTEVAVETARATMNAAIGARN